MAINEGQVRRQERYSHDDNLGSLFNDTFELAIRLSLIVGSLVNVTAS
jgi:hypothetical protein